MKERKELAPKPKCCRCGATEDLVFQMKNNKAEVYCDYCHNIVTYGFSTGGI